MSAIKQWWHCLINFHRGMDATEQMGNPAPIKFIWRGCECGKTFFGSKPEWYDRAAASPVPEKPTEAKP